MRDLSEAAEVLPIDDAVMLRNVLIDAAKARQALTYSQVLGRLGHRFTRPKMRLLCRTLGQVDVAARAAGEPEMAVLVVRGASRRWFTTIGAAVCRYCR